MNTKPEKAVRDILTAINVDLKKVDRGLKDPVEACEVDRAVELHGRDNVLLTVRSSEGFATIGLIEKDWSTGCPGCLRSRARGIDYFYGGLASEDFDADFAREVVALMFREYGVALAVTEAYDPQNWSVMLPVPFCSVCGGIDRQADRVAFWSASGTISSARPVGESTAGFRNASPDEFVGRNRAAIGFASAIGNPVAVETALACSLVNGPILMSDDPSRHEVAGGKGPSLEQSLASCLGEGLERYFTARPFRDRSLVATCEQLGSEAVDPQVTFGFPAIDDTDGVQQYRSDLSIEWVRSEDLGSGGTKWFPANLVFCPYVPPPGASTISTGSTNGAACGATREDAILQALLELVERDAFWYYSRTGLAPMGIPEPQVPADVLEAMRRYGGAFHVQLLVNPFGLPVVQVAYESNGHEASATARGTGVTGSLELSIRRAFTECIQMLESLSSGQAVGECVTDMRRLWFTGESREAFPQFFEAVATAAQVETDTSEFRSSGELLSHIVGRARRQGLDVYAVTLVETPSFSVVRAAMSSISIMDSTYFAGNDRMARFASLVGHDYREPRYHGSLFM